MSATDEFVHNYSQLLVHAWTDPSFMEILTSHPVAALRTQGLGVPPDATVTIETRMQGAPDLQAQIAAWEQGHTTKRYILYLPPAPLLGIHAGTTGIGKLDTSYCCCCCPCCSCT